MAGDGTPRACSAPPRADHWENCRSLWRWRSRARSPSATSAASPATEARSWLSAAISSGPSARPRMVGCRSCRCRARRPFQSGVLTPAVAADQETSPGVTGSADRRPLGFPGRVLEGPVVEWSLVQAERAVLRVVNAGCEIPLGRLHATPVLTTSTVSPSPTRKERHPARLRTDRIPYRCRSPTL